MGPLPAGDLHLHQQAGTDAVPCSDEMQKRERRSCGQPDFLLRSVR